MRVTVRASHTHTRTPKTPPRGRALTTSICIRYETAIRNLRLSARISREARPEFWNDTHRRHRESSSSSRVAPRNNNPIHINMVLVCSRTSRREGGRVCEREKEIKTCAGRTKKRDLAEDPDAMSRDRRNYASFCAIACEAIVPDCRLVFVPDCLAKRVAN